MTTLDAQPRRIVATQVETEQAKDATTRLPTAARNWIGRSTTGHDVVLPRELSDLMSAILHVVASGGTVTVGSLPPEITTTTAAEMLGISRPTLMKLVRAGKVPSHKVGSHTRLLSSDVVALKESTLAERRMALEELMALEDGSTTS